jgi:hypothetical protein
LRINSASRYAEATRKSSCPIYRPIFRLGRGSGHQIFGTRRTRLAPADLARSSACATLRGESALPSVALTSATRVRRIHNGRSSAVA